MGLDVWGRRDIEDPMAWGGLLLGGILGAGCLQEFLDLLLAGFLEGVVVRW